MAAEAKQKTAYEYRVNVHWGEWHPGAILKESELPLGTNIERSIQRGTISRVGEGYNVVIADDDLDGWRKRAAQLEEENLRLQTATPGAKILTEFDGLTREHEALLAEHATIKTTLSRYEQASVPRDDYEKLLKTHNALESVYNSAVAELDTLKKVTEAKAQPGG